MKSTGMARKIDDLGRLVLPAEIRRRFGLTEGTLVEIAVDGDSILLSRLEERCVFCDGSEELHRFRDRSVCGDCRRRLTSDGGPLSPA